jgi:2-keto-4-pentenoate hydratase/2-oxohepta-3-ene-1,7-dioic acid hydratase in catechol pathway
VLLPEVQRIDFEGDLAVIISRPCHRLPDGPVIETEFDGTHGTIESLLSGVRKQYNPLTDMNFPIDVIIPWISRVMTLLPGDVIAAGTPAGVGPMKAGDVVEVVVPGIGEL